jgi:hypothetical protein
MSIDHLSPGELITLARAKKAEIAARSWKHLPQMYTVAGTKKRAAADRGDRQAFIAYAVWSARAIQTEHRVNRRLAVKLFNGEIIA